MRQEEPVQVPGPHAEAGGELFEGVRVEKSRLNEAQSARNRCRRSSPCRRPGRSLRSAPKARTKARGLGGRRTAEESDMFPQGSTGRTHRSAVYSGCHDTGEKSAVEPWIPALNRAIADIVFVHARTSLQPNPAIGLADFGPGIGCDGFALGYSHSMVAGGLLEMS